MSRASNVNSKYGARALIEMPPIALDGERRRHTAYEDVPERMFRHNTGDYRSHTSRVYHQPPRAPQPSLTVPPLQRRYQEPLMVDRKPQIYQQPPPQIYQQQQPQVYQQPPPPQPQPPYTSAYQPPPPNAGSSYPYSNLVQNSNIVPYESYSQPPPPPAYPAAPPLYPAAPPVYSAPPQQNSYSNQNGNVGSNGGIHIYYGPNGERLSGPVKPSYPTDFTIEGTLEYGKLVSVKVRNSNISYRDIPQFVLRDLEKMYGMLETTDVKIVAQGGEYNIYATPKIQEGEERHYGYMYEPQPERPARQPLRSRDVPIRRDAEHHNRHYRYDGKDRTRRDSTGYDRGSIGRDSIEYDKDSTIPEESEPLDSPRSRWKDRVQTERSVT